MIRCCNGSWYLLPNGSLQSWAFVCTDCDRILWVADGDRDEVLSEWP